MALWYGLYKLSFRDRGITEPQAKVQPLPVPAYQANRHHQNVSIIPNGLSSINDNTRDVYIVSRVLAGGAAGGLVGQVEKYYGGYLKGVYTLGLSVLLDDAPDPTHHWGVLVGGYVHQLGIDNGYNYYSNETFNASAGWTKYKIGVTRFNDIAVRNAAMNAMNEMPEVYNLLDNNCQHFAARLLDKILRDGRKKLKGLNHQFMSATYPNTQRSYQATSSLVLEKPKFGDGRSVSGNISGFDHQYIQPSHQNSYAPESDEAEYDWLEFVSVGDEDDDLAVVYDEDAHLEMLAGAIDMMIDNTPTVKEGCIISQRLACLDSQQTIDYDGYD